MSNLSNTRKIKFHYMKMTAVGGGELTLNLTAHKTQQHSNYRFHKSSHAMSHRAATGKEGIQRTSDNEK